MAKSKGPKLYAVAKGRVPGIYNTWSECQAQTSGFGGARFKSFTTSNEAQAFMQSNNSSSTSSSVSSAANPSDNGKKRSRETKIAASSNQRQKQQSLSTTSNARLQITIYFDGGSRGNPGVAGAGAAVTMVDKKPSNATSTITTYSIREYCGNKATNNYAEYKGLLAGLKQAKLCIEQLSKKSLCMNESLFQLNIYGDSNLIIQQLKGNWQCRHANLTPLFQLSQELIGAMKNADAKSEVLYEHVYREHNKVADALANEAMDRRESWVTSTDDCNTSEDEQKKSAVAVGAKSKKIPAAVPAVARSRSGLRVGSINREVIDECVKLGIDVDYDSDSHYSV